MEVASVPSSRVITQVRTAPGHPRDGCAAGAREMITAATASPGKLEAPGASSGGVGEEVVGLPGTPSPKKSAAVLERNESPKQGILASAVYDEKLLTEETGNDVPLKKRRSSVFLGNMPRSALQERPMKSPGINTPSPLLKRKNSVFMSSVNLGLENEDDFDSDVESDPGGDTETSCDICLMKYHIQARKVRKLTRNPMFDQFIITVIIIAGILVGVQTYPLDPLVVQRLEIVDTVILAIFSIEVVLKILAEGRRPKKYFQDAWNVFDFLIVLAAFTPGVSSQATILRLLRLLRVLKLVKALPQLQIIIISLINSFSSLGYIAVLMAMLFYLFAILAVMLFGANDPHHFGTLHISFLSLWRSATGEDWTDLMYIAMYGCAAKETATGGTFYDDDLFRAKCNASAELYLPSVLYHHIFAIFAGLILLNLMVGVIIGSIFEAKATLTGDSVEITVERATNLPIADIAIEGFSSSDPFCKVRVGDQVFRTKVMKNNLNPVWNETFVIPLAEVEKEVVKFEVFDWDRIGSDDLLGRFKFDFSSMRWNKPARFEIELDMAENASVSEQDFCESCSPRFSDCF